MRSTCAEFEEAQRLFQEAVSAYEVVQEDVQECVDANCAPRGSAARKRLVAIAEGERRRREFRGARVSFLGRTHKIFSIRHLHRRLPREHDGDVFDAELSFYLGFKKSVSGGEGVQRFEYLKTGLPALVGSPNAFKRKEYRAYEPGTNYRLYVTPKYYSDNETWFSYSVAGQVAKICERIDSSNGEVFSFGQVIKESERFPVGLEMNWIVSTKGGVENSNINFFPVVEKFLEEAFGMAPPTEAMMGRYESSCSCFFCKNRGLILKSIGQIRRKLGQVAEGGWPTAREMFLQSRKTFKFSFPVRRRVDSPAVMVLNVKYGDTELGQIVFDRFYDERGDAWKLQVRSVRTDRSTWYKCETQ